MINVKLESVLQQHSESVSSVRWGMKEESKQDNLCLLSSSFDFTVCLWTPDVTTGLWSVDSTLGAVVGNKHAYFGADFVESTEKILAYTYNGALHSWSYDGETF